MIERIYATRLLGVSNDDIRRLEADEYERAMIELARIAEEHGLELDQVVREAYEAGERVLRWGPQRELRRIAQEFGMSEEEVRADYEAQLEDCGQ